LTTTEPIRSAGRLVRYRYLLLSVGLVVLMAGHITNRTWAVDFWGHAASVRELAAHPWAPQNPFIKDGSQVIHHHDFSPYTLALGLLCRYTGISPVKMLTGVSLVNLVLLLVAFRSALGFLETRDRDGVAFYSFLALLVLWGPNPWQFSGFFHLNVLGYVLPYPSTFALIVSLFGWTVMNRILSGRRQDLFILLTFLMAVALLTHPSTASVFYVGCIALVLGQRQVPKVREVALLAGAIAGSLVLASLWPYSPFLELLRAHRAVFDPGNRPMYLGVIRQTFPVLVLGGFAMAWRVKKHIWRDPLVLMFAGFSGIYFAGFVLKAWTLGRVISFMVLVLDIAIGCSAVAMEGAAASVSSERLRQFRMASIGVVLALCGLFFLPGLYHSIPFHRDGYGKYLAVSRFIKKGDVVLSDVHTGWPIPALFGGKVVAPLFPSFYRHDGEERRQAVRSFLSPEENTAERREIASKYQVTYVLLDSKRLGTVDGLIPSLVKLGRLEYSEGSLSLYRIERAQWEGTVPDMRQAP